MKPSIVVHGPQACGKTRNAELLRKKLGLDFVVDDFSFRDKSFPREGALLLTNETPPKRFLGAAMTFAEAIAS